MKSFLNIFGNHSFKTIIIICLILLVCVSCNDNATKFAKQLEAASNSLQFKPKGSQYIINYRPVNKWTKEYVIVLIPEREINLEELVAKGLSYDVGYNIFLKLGYLDVGYGDSMLIVYQDGDINFTTYFSRFITFEEIEVIYGFWNQKIVVEKVNNSKNRIVQVVFKE